MTLGILETKSDGDVKSRRPCLPVKLDALNSSLIDARHADGDIVLRFLRLDRQFHTITHALSQVLAHGACSGDWRSASIGKRDAKLSKKYRLSRAYWSTIVVERDHGPAQPAV